jgi:hypothetical protein
VEGFLTDLRKPLAKILYPDYVHFTLSFLFSMVDEGVEKYHKPCLQLLHALLQKKLLKFSLSASPLSSSSPPSTTTLSLPSPKWGHSANAPSNAQEPTRSSLFVEWVVQLCKELQGNHWELALSILSNFIAAEVTHSSTSESHPVQSKSVSRYVFSAFSNKPGPHISKTVLNLDKVLSTDSRKPSVTIDKSVFSVVGSSEDDDEDNDEDDDRLDSSVEDQLETLLNEKSNQFDDFDTGRLNPFSKASFGHFPTFRGFDDLLAKLEALPEKDKEQEKEKEKEKEKDKSKDSDNTKEKEEKGLTNTPLRVLPPPPPPIQLPTPSKGLPPTAFTKENRLPQQPPLSNAKTFALANPKINASQAKVGHVNRTPVAVVSRGTNTSSSKYPTGGSDSSSGSSPSSTLRMRLINSFDSQLRKAIRKWRRVALQRNFKDTSEMFNVFPVAAQLMELLQTDYKTSYQTYVASLKTPIRTLLQSSSVLKGEGESDFSALFREVPQMMSSLISSKYRQKIKTNSSFAQTFTERRAKCIEEFNQQQLAYMERRVRVEDIKATILEMRPSFSELELLEQQFCLAICDLHMQLLLCVKVYIQIQVLVNDILTNESEATEKKKQQIVEEDMKRNRQVAELIKTYKQNVPLPPPLDVNSSQKSKESKGTTDSKSYKEKPKPESSKRQS